MEWLQERINLEGLDEVSGKCKSCIYWGTAHLATGVPQKQHSAGEAHATTARLFHSNLGSMPSSKKCPVRLSLSGVYQN